MYVFSLFVSVWLFQMLKWIISQKLLNVLWKVVTETLVSDFSFFSSAEIRMYWELIHSISLLVAKIKIFASQLFKGHWKTQQLQEPLEGFYHRAAGSLAEYYSLSLPKCLRDFGTQVLKLESNRMQAVCNTPGIECVMEKYIYVQVSSWFKLSWFFNSA